MAVCKMDTLAVGNLGRDVGLEHLNGRTEAMASCAMPQRVTLGASLQKRWPSLVFIPVAVQPSTKLQLSCNATSGGDNDNPPTKEYDVNEVVEKVVHDEKNQLPEAEKNTPEPLPEGEPSPFSPAIDQDENTEPFQGQGVSNNTLIEPPRASTQESAASSSLGEGLGVSEHSPLSADPVGGSAKTGGRDWRVHSSDGTAIGHSAGNSGCLGTGSKGTDIGAMTQSVEQIQRLEGVKLVARKGARVW